MVKEKNSEYAKIIGDIENIVKNIKEILEKKVERNNNLLKLYESMINTYEITNKINNYQIRKNILNAYSMKDIFKVEENYIKDSIFSEFKNINKKIEDFMDGNSLNETCYLNLFHCNDYIKIDSIDTKNLEFKINCICPKNSHKFENKNLSEFINENKQNNINLNYLIIYVIIITNIINISVQSAMLIFAKNAKSTKGIKKIYMIYQRK